MRTLAAFALALSLTACAQGGPRPEPVIERGGKPYQFTADPGALVAVDIAMQRSMRDDGFVKAAKNYAAKDAQILTTRRVPYAEFIADSTQQPPRFVRSTPMRALISCDGRMGAVITIAADADGAGWGMITVWANTRDGWRWIMQKSVKGEGPAEAPESVATKTAKCGVRPPARLSAPDIGVDKQVGLSPDQSLSFTSVDYKNGATDLAIALWDGQAMATESVLYSDGK